MPELSLEPSDNIKFLEKIRLKHKKFGRYKVSPKDDRTFDGIVFDSKWEAETYKIFKLQLPLSHIYRQVEYTLQPKFKDANGKVVREICYIADFVLSPRPLITASTIPDDTIVIDSKGHITDIFKLKNKMFMYVYGAVIRQVKRPADVQKVIDAYKLILPVNS